MDFYRICVREVDRGPRKGTMEVYPDFIVGRSKDLMIRGKSFYAIWDEAVGLWSTDEYDVQRIVDADLRRYVEEQKATLGAGLSIKDMRSFGSKSWTQFRQYVQNISDNGRQLDENLTFANSVVHKEDYVSRRLPYSLEAGDYSAWDELVGTLYSVDERAKIEWTIGAIVSGDSKRIQKFLVLYGPAGTGKSTILNIIQKLFEGYTTTFEAKALGSNNGAFATEVFKSNPLVAIQHDGDLSKIEDNTKLNSIISHEEMTMNEKYKASYTARVNAFLLMGTNQPVKISDAKSGIIRRLIDVHPTGVQLSFNHYNTLMSRVDFELGAIAHHCLEVYRSMGKNYYSSYRPTEMMLQTDVFFNFVEAHYDIFSTQEGVTLKQAYTLYKKYCEETGINHIFPQYKIREELRNYFDNFKDRAEVNGETVRSYYTGFNANKFKAPVKDKKAFALVMDETESLLDRELEAFPAQYASAAETPKKRWESVTTTLSDIKTDELHFVKVPENMIVIDFDLKDESGEKSMEKNLEAASIWPSTYAELSKSGGGVHLHYYYDGDPNQLKREYANGIEIKVFNGNASLRRRLSKCNATPVATINSGLPIKEERVLDQHTIQSERGLRALIGRCLKKDIHPHTSSSVSFIKKILDEAYDQGLVYDVTDMRSQILAFANNSTNQSITCLRMVQDMKFASEPKDPKVAGEGTDDRLVFYDLEVYPNLLVVCWKYQGNPEVVKMINPTPQDIEPMFQMKLVGFNNRRYDNHILYARYLGYDNDQIYKLSHRMINSKDMNVTFGEAYRLSYADIYDFSSKKQSLKKFQIDLGLVHKEMSLPWDEPVAEELWGDVVDYCANDVITTEQTFEDRKQDFLARQILADVSGLSVNDTTAKHTAKIIFGGNRYPQNSFVYTDLSKQFPGYEFDRGKSTYKGEEVGEGGYVYAEHGMYENVVVLDIASMHPTSIEQLNLFGEYTPNFSALKEARIAIKHGDYDAARGMLDGKLAPYLKDESDAKDLSYALKIVINTVYGLTSARFENPFKDPRNKDNIVAKRGALFMVDLKNYVKGLIEDGSLPKGTRVVHIKTDSIKVAVPSSAPGGVDGWLDEITDLVTRYGSKYGYDFEREAVYEKMCLVNDAVYVAKKAGVPPWVQQWETVGAQFAHPYVFKTLFTHEEVEPKDLFETKQVAKGVMYLDYKHDEPEPNIDRMHHVGRSGQFVPVTESSNGAVLYRYDGEKLFSVTGTKGFLWVEAADYLEFHKDDNPRYEPNVDYYEKLADAAVKNIEKYGSFEEFVK